MNLPKLVILGALEQQGKASGYDLMQELQRQMIHKWVDIKIGSIYYTLKQLYQGGAVREAGQVKEGNYPNKLLYEITGKGRDLFDQLQEEAFVGLVPHFYSFKLALMFNTRKSPQEIRQFAQRATAAINEHLAAMDAYLSQLDPQSQQYRRDRFFIEHDRRLFKVEKQWIQDAVTFVQELSD